MPRLSTRRRVALAVLLAVVAWVVFFSIDREHERTKTLAEGVLLVETIHVTRTPYFGMAEAGDFVVLPLPYESEDVVVQELRRDGRAVWRGSGDERYDFHISPDRSHAVAEHWVHKKPWRIVDLERGNAVTVREPVQPPTQYYEFLFRFAGWSADSRAAFAMIDSSMTNASREQRSYRGIWSVDAVTGAPTRVRECDLPWSIDPDWSATRCAGGPVR